MNPRIWLPLFLLPALFPGADEVTFHAEEGTEVVRTFVSEAEMELADMSTTVNGDDHSFGEIELSITTERTIVVADVYGPPGEGRPQHLTRTFQELEGRQLQSVTGPDGESGEEDRSLSSDLQGRRVAFEWDQEEEELEISFDDDGEDDEELLEPLREDMDLRDLLPDGEVDVGDSWDVDPAVFHWIRRPGGVSLSGEDDSPEEQREFEDQLRESLDGDLTATYQGVRDEGGRRVAVIELSIDVAASADGAVERDGAEVLRTVSEAFELEGELNWDLEGGHLHSLELSGSTEWSNEDSSTFEMPDRGDFEVVRARTLAGELWFSIAVERQ